MKRHYKIAICVLIPLLFVGVLGVGLFSHPPSFARADGGQTFCDAKGNPENNPGSSAAFPNLANQNPPIQVWLCPVNPFFTNDTVDCLYQRMQPTTTSDSIRCFPLNTQKRLNVICQTQGQGNSDVWDEIATVDKNNNPTYAYVADYFMDTEGKGFSADTVPNGTKPIPNCAGLNLPAVP